MADYQKEAVAAASTASSVPGAGVGSARKLRVGVIGLGIGRMHIEGWRQHPLVEVAAIADADPMRLEAVGEQFGITSRYTGAEAMLAEAIAIGGASR